MGVTPGDGRRNDRSSEGEFVKPQAISNEVAALARMGWEACYWKNGDQLKEFRAQVEAPFAKADSTLQQQKNALVALEQIIKELHRDLNDPDSLRGLGEALRCAHSVLIAYFDFGKDLRGEIGNLAGVLLEVVEHDQFLPSAVLADADELSLSMTAGALATLLLCLNYQTEEDFHTIGSEGEVRGWIARGLDASITMARSCTSRAYLDEEPELACAVIRDIANLAHFFPSPQLQRPLLILARVCAELANEAHLYFPDVEAPYEEFHEADFDDVGDPDPESEFKSVVAACLSSLVCCQEGAAMVPTWKHILDNLDHGHDEWASAIAGLSLAKPEEIDVYIAELFDDINTMTEDRESDELAWETSVEAICQLLEVNGQATTRIKDLFRQRPPKEQQQIKEQFERSNGHSENVVKRIGKIVGQ